MNRSNPRSWWRRMAGSKLGAPRAPGASRAPGGPRAFARWPLLVGVDVSDTSARVVRVARRGGRIVRVTCAERPIPLGFPGAEREAAVAAALREMVAELGARGNPAATSLTGPEVLVRRLSLPSMSRADILPALTLECRKLVGFPIEEAEIRYESVGRTEAPLGPVMELLTAVVRRSAVEARRETLAAAGLRPVAITLHSVGLLALLNEAREARPDEVVAYLDMGTSESHIMVLKGPEIRFARELGVGGSTFTEALRAIVVPGQGTVEVSEAEAEALKREHGIPRGDDEAALPGRIPAASVAVMIRPVLERLVREVWNSFDYVNEQYLGESVSRMVLLGAGSRIRNLETHLAGVLKIPVERADWSERVMPRPDAGTGPISERGLGLALVGRDVINFLAPANAGWPYRAAEAVPQRAAAAAAALLLLSVSLPAEVSVLRERQRVGTLRGGLESLRPGAVELRRFRAARLEETRLRDLLARLSGGQALWSYVLRDLSHRVGPAVRLTSFEVVEPPPGAPGADPAAAGGAPGREVRMAGLLDLGRDRPEKVLGELMQSLSESPALDRVRLTDCRAAGPALASFSVTARLVE